MVELFFNQAHILSHLITAVIFFIIGFYTHSLIQSKKNGTLDVRLVSITIINVSILLFYVIALAHTQFFDGKPPSLVFSAMGAYAFGSLVGEKNFLLELIKNIKGK